MPLLDTEHYKAWHQGRTAMVEGYRLDDNPFPLFTTDGDYWAAGFMCLPLHTMDHSHKGE